MDSKPSDDERGFGWRKTRYERLTEAMQAYGQVVQTMLPVGSGFKVESPRGPRYLKRFRYGPQELWFMYYCLEHLRGRGFTQAPRVYMTLEGQPYVDVDGEVYYLQDWLELARPDFSDPGTLRACVRMMAELHLTGEGFAAPAELAGVRNEYGSWLDKSIKRLREVYGFAELAEEDVQGLRFDKRYARAAPVFFRHAEDAVRRLAELPLAELAEKEREAGAVCHRNFTPRNIALEDRAGLRILDFDNCAREIRLDDLARFIRRAANLDLERAAFIVQSYGEARGRELAPEELALISAYLLFPREFWIVGRSRFHKQHRRERLLRRLIESAEDWGRFAEGVESLSTAVLSPALQHVPAAPAPRGLPEDVAIPEGPEQPLVPLGVTPAGAPQEQALWRADEVCPEPQPEEVSAVERPSPQVPGAQRPPEVEPGPGVGTVPAHFPEGVEPYVLPAKARPAPGPPAEKPAAVAEEQVEVTEEPAAVTAEPVAVVAGPSTGEAVPAAAERAAAEPPAVAEVPAPEEPAAEEAVAESPAAEAEEPAERSEDELTGAEYRAARETLATSGRTLVWGKWPKPVKPKDEGSAEHEPGY